MHGCYTIKKIKHSMLSVTVVYLRDVTDTIFVILHLNVNHLRVCCSCICIKFDIQLRQFGLFVSGFCTSVSQTANMMLVSFFLCVFFCLFVFLSLYIMYVGKVEPS